MLTIILSAVGVLILLLLLIGFTSPRVATMERSILIKASENDIFPYLNNLKSFVDHWSPWTEKDPNAKHVYNEIAKGIGAHYSWKGEPKKVGEGSMEIIESELNKRVKTLLNFKGRGAAFAAWTVKNAGDHSKVTWNFESDNGMNPVGRIFGRFMDKFLGPDYEKGLNKLKEVIESKT